VPTTASDRGNSSSIKSVSMKDRLTEIFSLSPENRQKNRVSGTRGDGSENAILLKQFDS
jgi:hypothetical protein